MGDAAIWKVDRFATHDGPGIRMNLYFKGCPLRCLWCSNPEGQLQNDEIGFEKSYGLTEVMELVRKDRHIYRRSGGGITCTGGEPFEQAELLICLLKACREQGIHTAVETCGHGDPARFQTALPDIDWLFFDLKHLDPGEHRRITGRDNKVILANLRMASSISASSGQVLAIRQVVVPGLNDGENIQALAKLAKDLPRLDYVELLAYHEYGRHKYKALARQYPLEGLEPPSDGKMCEYREIVRSYGVECRIGVA